MIKRAMIDLETLGTKPGCVILEIGIVCNFPSPDSSIDSDWGLDIPVRITGQKVMIIDPDTIAWWMKHPDAWARICANQIDTDHPDVASDVIFHVLSMCDEIWANSPSFDCAILSHFISHYTPGVGIPWKHSQERDFRTARALHPEAPYTPPENAHGALADAIAQAAHLDKLGIWRS